MSDIRDTFITALASLDVIHCLLTIQDSDLTNSHIERAIINVEKAIARITNATPPFNEI